MFLPEIVKDQTVAFRFFSTYCENALRAQWDLIQQDWEFDPSGASASKSFGFRKADLVFIFAARHVGAEAFGRTVVELPFNDVYRFLTNRIIDLLAGPHGPVDSFSDVRLGDV